MTKETNNNTIALNRKALHDYFIEAQYEVGLELLGWEVKSIRAGRVNLKESYVTIRANQCWLLGSHISPLSSASTHVNADPVRTRRLLLHRKEINKLIGAVQREGYSMVILSLYWKKQKIKANIALVKGKKLHDKRAAEKEKDWSREKSRLMKQTGE